MRSRLRVVEDGRQAPLGRNALRNAHVRRLLAALAVAAVPLSFAGSPAVAGAPSGAIFTTVVAETLLREWQLDELVAADFLRVL